MRCKSTYIFQQPQEDSEQAKTSVCKAYILQYYVLPSQNPANIEMYYLWTT